MILTVIVSGTLVKILPRIGARALYCQTTCENSGIILGLGAYRAHRHWGQNEMPTLSRENYCFLPVQALWTGATEIATEYSKITLLEYSMGVPLESGIHSDDCVLKIE